MEKQSNHKVSAVALVLFEDDTGPNIILIQRPAYQGVHSAQVALPGGKHDPEDASVEYTARREVSEEVGLTLSTTHLLGPLTPLYIPVSNFIVHPHLYLFPERNLMLTPNSREVESIFYLPIHHLLNEENVRVANRMLGSGLTLPTPYFEYEGREIWGATAMILSELKQLWLENR